MASVFISHSSVDRAVAAWLMDQFRSAGFAALFVDFDPKQGIPAGRNWEREVYTQLRQADALIFLASEASVESRWCFAELTLARSLGRPVFPLRLQPGVQLPLVADVQWVDLSDAESGLARLLGGLQVAGLDADDSFAWDPRRSPYPGLVPFETEDAAVFRGRRQETDRLLNLLTPTPLRGPGRFVAIVGPSGSGKSSLLHAGLLPRLARMSGRWLVLPPLRPGEHPNARLVGCLTRAFTAYGHPRPADQVAAMLDTGSAGLVQLASELADMGSNGASRPSVLVVIDQAEELLTRTGAREQQSFLQLLTGALDEDSPVWVVATLRSEFLSNSPERSGLADAVDESLLIEPLSRDRLPEVIARPAQRAGLDYVPGLVERIVDETAGGDALPLLGYTLHELYEHVGRAGVITEAEYEAVGGVIGALERRADALDQKLRQRGLGDVVLPTLMRLASVSGQDQPTRRRVRRSAFDADQQVVVDAFVDASLLVSRADPADPAGEPVVEVAHEALLRQWPPLSGAIEADRGLLRLRSELERLAADWHRGHRDDSYLLRGERLAMIDDWAHQHPGELGATERQFVEASRALATRELEAARRSLRQSRALSGGLAVLLVAALVASGVALNSNREAQAQARLALSRQLAGAAERLVGTRPDVAILAGLQSLSFARDDQPRPSAALMMGMGHVTHASRLLTGHTDAVRGVAFTSDGKLLATASADKAVRLWEVDTGTPHGAPLEGDAALTGVAFSPDGKLLATASEDSTAQLWEVDTGKPRGAPLEGHADALTGVAFSPDGKLLATSSADKTVRLWNVATGEPYGVPLEGHTDAVRGVAFSPDGRLLATASADKTVRLWDVGTGEPHGPALNGHTDRVNGVAFSPDGDLLATAGEDSTARLWNVDSGEPQGPPLEGPTNGVRGVAFSPDGELLATASVESSATLWNVATGQPQGPPLAGHTNTMTGVTFNPDGTRLATASADGTARLWEVAEKFSISRALTGHTDTVYGVAFDPEGKLLATGSEDSTARLWDVGTFQPHGLPLRGHTEAVRGVAFSPNGKLLATASEDSTAQLWDVDTGKPHGAPLKGHTDALTGVAFSPDGRLLATASSDTTVRLWDVDTGQQHGPPLIGHDEAVRGVAFSPDGDLLATASADHTARLWDVDTGKLHGAPLTGHTSWVTGVAFSPDGGLLATSSSDDTVRLWTVKTRERHGVPLAGHTEVVIQVAFSPNGKLLATASRDFTARLWNPFFTAWVKVGCELVGRNLSITEWNQLLPGVPYERTCPGLPVGEGAPSDAPAAQYAD
jgi:WD40 repeat protein/energy-coupling factor transporter ATP-binding protein EcfA2